MRTARFTTHMPVARHTIVACFVIREILYKAFGGYTASLVHQPVFRGEWRDDKGERCTDEIMLLWSDCSSASPGCDTLEVRSAIGKVKNKIVRTGEKQTYIVKQPIYVMP